MNNKWEKQIEKAITYIESQVEKTKSTPVGFLHRILIPHNPPRPECQNNIICTYARSCGRRSCPAYTVSAVTYHRKLKAVE